MRRPPGTKFAPKIASVVEEHGEYVRQETLSVEVVVGEAAPAGASTTPC
jgi:hypothetical protein